MADPSWSSVVTYLRFNAAGSSTVTDEVGGSRTWTLNGGAAQSATGAIKGGSSLRTVGNTGSMYVSSSDNLSDWQFGTGDFTLDVTIQCGEQGPDFFTVLAEADDAWFFRLRWFGRQVEFMGREFDPGAGFLTDGLPHAIRLSRVSGVLYCQIDGRTDMLSPSSYTYTDNLPLPTGKLIARGVAGDQWFDGVLDEFRVTKGVGRSTGAYTPDAGEFETGGGGGDVTLALTGVEGTSANGSITSDRSKALTGNAGTGAVGTVVQSRTKALTNNVGTGAPGTVVQSRSLDAAGVEAAGFVGDVAVDGMADVTVAISGVEASSDVGAVGAAIDLSLSGIEGASSVGDSVSALSFALSGVSAVEGAGTLAAEFASGLSAASASGTVGTTASSLSLALSGQFATGDAGIFVPSASAALTGMQADAAVGDVAIAGAGPGAALAGVQGTASTGAVGMSVTISLAGVAGSAFAGYVAPPASQVVLGSLIGRTRQAFGIRSSVQTSTRRNEQSSKR